MSRRLALVLVLALAGCSSGNATLSPSPTPSSTASSSPTPPPAPTPSASPTASPTPSPPAKLVLLLEPDGLGLLRGEASIRHFTFADTTAREIKALVTQALGGGTAADLPDCGQGPRSSYTVKGFALLFDGTRFVGWSDRGAPGRTLSGVEGTGIGLTLAELKGNYPAVKVTNGSLGPEFFVAEGAINGFLDGTTSGSKITSVYAGETCFFR